MRNILFVLTALVVIGLAFWAYRENYATQAALDAADDTRAEIRASHARLAVLRAEWAYLNRPERLQDLADLNFDRLGLLPLRPEQFGHLDEVAFPPQPVDLQITNAVEVANREVRQ
jgi:hypothetical protein